jgi:2-polyprenyl-3-methyl-5-hydroxy-6-metoxy-1,4-benzoquinol methylase
MDKKDHCPVCQETQHHLLYPVANGELVTCQSCRLTFFTPRPSIEDLAAFYNTEEYRDTYKASVMADLTFAQTRYRHLHNVIVQHHPSLLELSSKHLLDIGCGRGDLLQIAAQSGWNVSGIEISPLAVQQANQLLKEVRVQVGDLESLDLADNSYSLITSYHVIEHLLEPVKHLTKIRQLVQPGGIVFIETPNLASLGAKVRGKRWSHIIPPEHINYFTPDSLRYTLCQAGFQKYIVFTSAPPIIESIEKWHPVAQAIATKIYGIAPSFNLGAALQAVAFKE